MVLLPLNAPHSWHAKQETEALQPQLHARDCGKGPCEPGLRPTDLFRNLKFCLISDPGVSTLAKPSSGTSWQFSESEGCGLSGLPWVTEVTLGSAVPT